MTGFVNVDDTYLQELQGIETRLNKCLTKTEGIPCIDEKFDESVLKILNYIKTGNTKED